MSDSAVEEVVLALRRHSDLSEARGATDDAAVYARYADSLEEALAIVGGSDRTMTDVRRINLDVMSVSDPSLLGVVMTHRRAIAVHPAVLKLGGRVTRVEKGLPAKKFFGLLG